MASAAPAGLPLFYQDLTPLSSQLHAGWNVKMMESASFFAQTHAVPLTTEEFGIAQRHCPIVFSDGPSPVPLALFGLNEGVNVFTDENGMPRENFYVPAYVRRYPFMLAKLNPDAEELSLCFDPTSGALGEFAEGDPIFEGSEPSARIKELLEFCEKFERAGATTGFFIEELQQNKLLIPGEVSISVGEDTQPFVYRGFQMIAQERVLELRGDVLRKMVQNGVLPLIYAHLFSLQLMQEIFNMQMQQGKMPQPNLTVPS
jgi:hypothetical protein